MKSALTEGSIVTFPEFTGERVYLKPFHKGDDLGRWSDTVDSMLSGIYNDGELYLTIDQSFVEAGIRQRREGVHIDCEVVNENGFYAHGSPAPVHRPLPPRHNPRPSRCQAKHGGGIVLASSHIGCRAWSGEFDQAPRLGGDCNHVDLSRMKESLMRPFVTYIGNSFMIHEALPALESQQRTFVRVSIPAAQGDRV